jgi:polysaccharide export outer membrane protein
MKRQTITAAVAALLLSGCSVNAPFLSGVGPSADVVVDTPRTHPDSGIVVLDVTSEVAQRVIAVHRNAGFASLPRVTEAPNLTLGPGDTVEISIWEAPPAALFSNGISDLRGMTASTSRVAVVPEQMVTKAGTINMPFVGNVKVAGRMPAEVEADIAKRLAGLANKPQVVVRTLKDVSSSVTIVGEVGTSTRLPLSPRGDRLLDALASVGGVRQPVGKVTVQVTRESADGGRRVARTAALPLDTVIADPEQNILLQPGDIVTVLHLSNSFTVLGAVSRNEEINFETQGITLAQALGRAGGLRDERANPRAVFIFRFEDPAVLGDAKPAHLTAQGKVPVVYKVDLKDPGSFFVAQDFPIRNKDVMYVSDAPAAELQKFLNLLSSVTVPFLQVKTLDN